MNFEIAAEASSSDRPTVWIVDDSPLEAELVRRTLADVYQVDVFTDGATVIEQLASERPPDAVVLDWRMPGISGLDVCKFLRGRPQTQAVPILMLTVQRDTRDLVQCLTAGADDFLSKPCNAAELSARVAALVRSKRLHERAQSAERAVRSLLMQLPEGVVSVDATGHITFANLEAQRTLAPDTGALVGKRLRDVLPGTAFEKPLPDSADPVMLPDLVLNGRVLAPAIRRYAGVTTTETTVSFRDVTAHREEERRRAALLEVERIARRDAEEASKAKDEFLAVLSHELRTPLNAILGWALLVRSGSLDETKRARALETIERNAASQQKLIEDILDVSRIITGKMSLAMSRLDLGLTVRSVVDGTRPSAEAKGLDLAVDIPDAGPLVVGDATRLQQVVSNIVNNAVKFTPRGGRVSVSAAVDDGWASLQVSDTGQGIRPELLPVIFDRFRQGDTGTSRSHSGLGLGLSIARHLVEMHGGQLEAQSAGTGLGSTFTIRVPCATSDSLPQSLPPLAAPTSPLVDEGTLRGTRILIVDDDEDARELLVATFQELGAEPIAVSSVAEAMDAIPAVRPMVIVSDIGMPVDDGYALVARLRALQAAWGGNIPAVALSAFAASRDGERAIAAGFSAYLAKPVHPGKLIGVLAKLVDRSAQGGEKDPA